MRVVMLSQVSDEPNDLVTTSRCEKTIKVADRGEAYERYLHLVTSFKYTGGHIEFSSERGFSIKVYKSTALGSPHVLITAAA